MKKYYRSRIMLSGVLSFLIILVIAVAGIWLFSYQRIEENADSFIASELQKNRGNRENAPRFTQDSPPMFGYRPGRRNNPSGFYELLITGDGEISIERKSDSLTSRRYSFPSSVATAFISRGIAAYSSVRFAWSAPESMMQSA